MRILYINSVYGYGSTGKLVRQLKEDAEAAGNEAFVIYGRKSAIGQKGTEVSESGVFLMENSLEQKEDILFSVISDSHGLHSRRNTAKMIEKIKDIDPDLIHLHNIHGFYLNYPDLFAFLKSHGKPVVWTLHDCWAYTGFCAYYDYNECSGWQTGCKACRFRNEYPYRLFSRSAYNYKKKKEAYDGADLTLVTPSEWLKSEVQKSMLGSYPCRVIYNSVNLKDFCYDPGNVRQIYHLEGKKIYLACANVWTEQKGYQECLKLAAKLNDDEVLAMVGLSDKQMKDMTEHMLGIAHCDIDRLRNWYSTCDAFFNPTLEDNYPTVNLEAAACGAPIITYRTGGSLESAGRNGIAVERYDTDDALQKLRQAERNKMNANTAGNHMTEEYLALYEEITGGNI